MYVLDESVFLLPCDEIHPEVKAVINIANAVCVRYGILSLQRSSTAGCEEKLVATIKEQVMNNSKDLDGHKLREKLREYSFDGATIESLVQVVLKDDPEHATDAGKRAMRRWKKGSLDAPVKGKGKGKRGRGKGKKPEQDAAQEDEQEEQAEDAMFGQDALFMDSVEEGEEPATKKPRNDVAPASPKPKKPAGKKSDAVSPKPKKKARKDENAGSPKQTKKQQKAAASMASTGREKAAKAAEALPIDW